MSEVTIEPGPDDTPTVVPLGAQSASVVSTDGQVVIGGLDATGVDEGYVPTADGADGWAWAEVGGGLPDTGTRNVASLIGAGNPAFQSEFANVALRRVGPMVTLTALVYMKDQSTNDSGFITLPAGFRPASALTSAAVHIKLDGSIVPSSVTIYAHGGVEFAVPDPPGRNGVEDWSQWGMTITFPTEQPWPTTLPGTPA